MPESNQSSLIRGTFILTITNILSKVLGFIYVVPFIALVGVEGNILFEYAYKPYAILLSIATMGIPMAVSKFVSKYNQLGDYRAGYTLFRYGMIITFITGTICCILLYSGAPSIAHYLIHKGDRTGNSVQDAVFVIHMVSFALIIVPPMAIARGYFQGHQSMEPTGISQVVEQLVRIIFILIAAILVIKVMHKSIALAVGYATFAATIGAVFGSIVLIYYWRKRKDEFQRLIKESVKTTPISIQQMAREIFSYAVPFVIVGLAIPLYQSIDTFLINKAMISIGKNQGQAETVNSIISLTQKIILIPISLASAFGQTLVPSITQSYTAKKMESLRFQITKTFQVILFLTMPAAIGLMILGHESFAVLFGLSNAKAGGDLMMWSAMTTIFFSLYTVTAAMLQGIDKQKMAIISLLAGFLFKALATYWFVAKFQGVGSVITTEIGMTISIILNSAALSKYAGYSFRSVLKQTSLILTISIVMAVTVWAVNLIGIHVFKSISSLYLQNAIRLILGAGIGITVYGIMSVWFGVFFDVFGSRFRSLNQFNRKKGA